MEYTLSMTFKTEYGATSSVSVSGVKPSITQAEVDSLMDTIIAKDVFITTTGKLVGKGAAQLIAKTVTKYDVA